MDDFKFVGIVKGSMSGVYAEYKVVLDEAIANLQADPGADNFAKYSVEGQSKEEKLKKASAMRSFIKKMSATDEAYKLTIKIEECDDGNVFIHIKERDKSAKNKTGGGKKKKKSDVACNVNEAVQTENTPMENK